MLEKIHCCEQLDITDTQKDWIQSKHDNEQGEEKPLNI